MEALPVIGGVAGLALDREDPKSKLFWLLGGLIAIVLVFESTGYSLGPLGNQIVGAFPLLLAYIIGSKDHEFVSSTPKERE